MALPSKICLFVLIAGASLGCQDSRRIRDPEYGALVYQMQEPHLGFDAATATPVVSPEIQGPHSVEEYIQIALGQNPKVHAIRKKMEALAYRVPVESSLQDPSLTVTLQPEPVQTAAGQQEAIVAVSQRFPWFGKLAAKAGVAEAKTNVVRAELAAIELDTVARVKKAYFELYFVQQAIRVTEADQQLLLEIRAVADTRYQAGDTSQQDVLRANLEVSDTENRLIQLRQQLDSGQARMAKLLHLAPDTELLAKDELPPLPTLQELDTIQQTAVAASPELHAKLAELSVSRRGAQLARLDYKPDMTLGMSWIDVSSSGISPVSDGSDALLLSAGVNLPIYRKRLDSAVRSAEASAVAAALEYDSLRDETLEQVTDLFFKTKSHLQLLELFREDILPNSKQTLAVSSQAYNVGEVDFLQLLDNWRQLLRYEISNLRLKATLYQTLSELEQVMGGRNVDGAEESIVPIELQTEESSRR